MELPIFKLRHDSYFPSFLNSSRLSEAALTLVIQEACVPGFSTRNVDRLVQAMGVSGVKRREVSRQCQELDTRVGSFLDRPLEGQWPFLWLDATYVTVREIGRIVSVAVTLALGVNDQGRREVLGLEISCSEADTFGTDFFRKLLRRGQGPVDRAERRMGRGSKLSEPRGSGSGLRRRQDRLGAGSPVNRPSAKPVIAPRFDLPSSRGTIRVSAFRCRTKIFETTPK